MLASTIDVLSNLKMDYSIGLEIEKVKEVVFCLEGNVKLAGLHIDRFGARTGLGLTDIADQLNIVYGPNGSGKTTVIQFIRWMMFGERDEISRRYLTTGSSPVSGSMSWSDLSGVRSVRRVCQSGSLISQLTVDGSPHTTQVSPGISASEFNRHFVLSFDQPRNIGDLLNSARSHGFQLHLDQRQLDRVQQLTEELNRYRSELSRYGTFSTADSLRAQRDDKRREIDNIRLEWQRRREELETQRNQLSIAVADQQQVTSRLQSVVSNIDSALENRKRQLETEYREWLEARRDSENRRLARIQEVDAQAHRWQEVLSEVRSRLEGVRTRVSSLDEVSVNATETTDLHFFMRRLGFRIRDIEQDISGVYEADTWRDHESDAEYLRGLLGSALNSMQNDVTRLCQTVEKQHHANELYETREELNYLTRVERELTDLIDALNRQRRQLDRPSELLPHMYGEVRHEFLHELDLNTPMDMTTLLNDFRLRHLTERRDAAIARLSEAELELSNRQRQLRDVEEELAHYGRDARTESLERDIVQIEEQLRLLEKREQVERTIASLEEQLRQARLVTSQSHIVDEASAILGKLTNNEYYGITVQSDHQCHVTHKDVRTAPTTQPFSRLSRGVQDQVYLALGLAIASAYRAKGVTVPLILNDVFVNLDHDATIMLADVLLEVASTQQQILVFTRHHHIRDLFSTRSARIFSIGEPVPTPMPAPLPAPPRPVINYAPAPIPTPPPAPVVELAPEPRDPTYQWVAEWHRKTPNTPAPSPSEKPLKIKPPKEDPPAAVVSRLTLSSPLAKAATLTDELVTYLSSVGARTIGEFIELDADTVEQQLGDHGITAEMIQRRQRELLMIVYLDVSVLDAQLLVACGVPDPARLSRADDAVLLKRIETILERPQAAQRFGAFAQYSLARVRRWIETAQASGYRGRTRRSYGARSAVIKPSVDTERPSSRRRQANNEAARVATVKLKQETTHRFYLEVNDPVVDAPSIGPKTAERLNEVDIYTVAHLLDANPEEVAARLDDRRTKAETVEQWQLQAQLVCRIPNLRGHDAQILVACGVEDPVTLSSMEATSFLKKVLAFVSTKDGQRVVRNGKKPDLAEVTAWIEWANSARQLRAA